MDWSGVDYCDVFISCLDTHSDGTHSLQKIHWWASDAMQIFFQNLFTWTNLAVLSKMYFRVNYSFKLITGVYENMCKQ